jgi:trigger factor
MESPRITVEDLTPIRKRLQIEIASEAVQAELDRAFQTVGRQARLPGFRPGKAPRSVLERAFGARVRQEVLERLVGESLHQAVQTHQLTVVGTPDIDGVEGLTLTPGETFRYSATVELLPPIELADLSGLEAVRPAATVTDADVDHVLEGLRESVAQLRPVEDRTSVEAGDVVVVDLESRLADGEPVKREGILLEAASGKFPLALENQLTGQHRGAHLSLRVPYPADYGSPSLAGKTAEFEVEIKELRVKELPPLDDDFARDHGRSPSLAEFRAAVRADLERDAVARAEQTVRDAVLEQLIARHEFEVPPTLVERRTHALIETLEGRLPEGAERERAHAQLHAQVRPRAERQIRAELLLDALASRDGVTVSDADLQGEIEAVAQRERQPLERVRALYDRPEARSALRGRLLRERALSALVAAAKVMPAPGAESVAREN